MSLLKTYDLHLPVTPAGKEIVLPDLLPLETLIRLSPHWVLDSINTHNSSFSLSGTDYESGEPLQYTGALKMNGNGITLLLDQGNIRSINLINDSGTFRATAEFDDETFDDKTEYRAVTWIRGIQEYIRLYLGKSVNALLFRYLMNRIILKMTPSQRKISLMLIRITILELVLILIIVIGYYFFGR